MINASVSAKVIAGTAGNIMAAATATYLATPGMTWPDLSWLISGHHALTVSIGLLGGMAARTVLDHHTGSTPDKRGVRIVVSELIANFIIAYLVSYWFATLKEPQWPPVLMIAMLISMTGVETMMKARTEMRQRYLGTPPPTNEGSSHD